MSAAARERRPAAEEFAPFYEGYVAAVPDGDVVETLEREGRRFVAELRSLAPESASHAYAPGKWTLAEVLAHLADSERVFAYRALRFGRADTTALPGFDHDLWVPESHARTRPLAALIDELEAVRAASLHLFRSFEPGDWDRAGEASGNPITVRALAWIIAGHALHHRRILAERYGLGG